jgi:hypothetical protein
MCKCSTDKDHQTKIFGRYLEFCNFKWDQVEGAKFSYDYKRNTMTVVRVIDNKRIEFNIADFIDWDWQKYPENPCFSSLLNS